MVGVQRSLAARQLRDKQVHTEEGADHEQCAFMTAGVFFGELFDDIEQRLHLFM